jgi:hypothetical protein
VQSRLASFVGTQRFDAAVGAVLFVLAEIETANAGELGTFGLAVPFFTLTLAWRAPLHSPARATHRAPCCSR